MQHQCGQSFYHLHSQTNGLLEPVNELGTHVNSNIKNETTVTLYTSYLGPVLVTGERIDSENIGLESQHKINNNNTVRVKVVDAVEHNINHQLRYPLNNLRPLKAKVINIEKNKYYYILTQMAMEKILLCQGRPSDSVSEEIERLSTSEFISLYENTYPELFTQVVNKPLSKYKKIYQEVVKYNSPVDIIFCTCNYLDFLYEKTQMISVNKLDTLISVSGVPKLDNAYFTGQYMMYGAGDKMFYPLTAADVIGHELSHGLVSGTANLEYKGHSGALNESFADVVGVMFEFWLYDKYPQLHGKEDWMVGEDLGMTRPFLRSFENPEGGNQPSLYQGKHYLNPNSEMDFGGVHINSGITNHCFYLMSQEKDKYTMFSHFINCLLELTKRSNFMDFRDTLKRVSQNDPTIQNALNTVGFTDSAVTDYGKQPSPSPSQQNGFKPLSSIQSALNNTVQKFLSSRRYSNGIWLAVGTVEGSVASSGGWADKTIHKKTQDDDPLQMGSTTKMLCANYMYKCIDKGLVKIDKRISKYIPEYSSHFRTGDQITVRHLLEMSSGLVDHSNSIPESEWSKWYFTPMEIIKATPPNSKFTPGTRYDYCNTNYLLLGLIIKKVTGKHMWENDDFYGDNLNGKLSSTIFPLDKGYPLTPSFDSKGMKHTYYHPTPISYTAGMCVSTVKDYSTLFYELFSRPWITQTSFDTFTAKNRSTGQQGYYGGGCYVGGGFKELGGGDWTMDDIYCHSGLYPGDWLTMVLYCKKYDFSFVVNWNSSEPVSQLGQEVTWLVNTMMTELGMMENSRPPHRPQRRFPQRPQRRFPHRPPPHRFPRRPQRFHLIENGYLTEKI